MRTGLIFSILVFFLMLTSIGLKDAVSLPSHLFYAVKNGDVERAKFFLHRRDADPNEVYKGWTLLHIAANNNNPEMVELLIREGANVNAIDKQGYAPIHYAVLQGPEVMKVLAGNILTYLDIKDKHGWTALQHAKKRGKVEIEKILLRAGAKAESVKVREFSVPRADLEGEKQGFWEGVSNQQGFTEGFQYGYKQGLQGNAPWYIWVFWLTVVGLFSLACYKGAEKRGRNPWIWTGATAICILLPLICWIPYVALRILGTSAKQQENDRESLS